MVIFAVDDERIALEGLVESIRTAAPEAEIYSFRYPEEVISAMERKKCDVVFADVEMSTLNGISLSEKLKELNPEVNIIFATGYKEYYSDAFALHASGYIVKPVTKEKVRTELDNLRYPVETACKKLRVHCFGNFEVYADGIPIAFKYSKAKEMLAYMVDRKGAMVTVGEFIAVLFDGESGHERYFKSIRYDLLNSLEKAGCLSAVAQQWGKLGIIPSETDCDYYDFLDGRGKNSYNGEYMSQYSWAEKTIEFFAKSK